MIQRVKEKQKKMKSTGGGPPIKLTENDMKILRLIGESNPQMARIPKPVSVGLESNAKENIDPNSTSDEESSDVDQSNRSPSMPRQSKRRKTIES